LYCPGYGYAADNCNALLNAKYTNNSINKLYFCSPLFYSFKGVSVNSGKNYCTGLSTYKQKSRKFENDLEAQGLNCTIFTTEKCEKKLKN